MSEKNKQSPVSTHVEIDLPKNYLGKIEPAEKGGGFVGFIHKADTNKAGKVVQGAQLYKSPPLAEHKEVEETLRKWVVDYEAHLQALADLKAKLRGEALPKLEKIEDSIARLKTEKSHLSAQIKKFEKERGDIIRDANHPQLDFIFQRLEKPKPPKKGSKKGDEVAIGGEAPSATPPPPVGDAVDFESIGADDAKAAIAACTDLKVLEDWGHLEEDRKKPRKQILSAIDERWDELDRAVASTTAPRHTGLDPSKVDWSKSAARP